MTTTQKILKKLLPADEFEQYLKWESNHVQDASTKNMKAYTITLYKTVLKIHGHLFHATKVEYRLRGLTCHTGCLVFCCGRPDGIHSHYNATIIAPHAETENPPNYESLIIALASIGPELDQIGKWVIGCGTLEWFHLGDDPVDHAASTFLRDLKK